MSETLEAVTVDAGAAHAAYTRNNPYQAVVEVNRLLTAVGSEKETRHVELSLEEGMTYTPGDAVGIVPENRRKAVDEVLAALGFTGSERVLDHYKVEISLDEALRTRLAIGVLERGRITQMAKLAPADEKLKSMLGQDNKARAEEYCYGREFVDMLEDYPGVITEPQQPLSSTCETHAAHVFHLVEPVGAPDKRADDRTCGSLRSAWTRAAGALQRASRRARAGGWDDADLSSCQRPLPASGG